jgi:hypothetical protein
MLRFSNWWYALSTGFYRKPELVSAPDLGAATKSFWIFMPAGLWRLLAKDGYASTLIA